MAVVPLWSDGVEAARLHKAAWAKVAVAHAVEAVDAGADIVHLAGGERRHGHATMTTEQEQERLMPVLEGLMMERPEAVVAVDVLHAETAHAALLAGAEIVNDLSGAGWTDALVRVVMQTGCGFVLRSGLLPLTTHDGSRVEPGDAKTLDDEIVPAVFTELCEQLMLAEEAGVAEEQIVAEPGFGGSGRGVREFALLAGLGRLRQLDRPLMIGTQMASGEIGTRSAAKRSQSLPTNVERRWTGTATAAMMARHVAAMLAGAHLLRVHDVLAAREAADVADAVLEAGDRE